MAPAAERSGPAPRALAVAALVVILAVLAAFAPAFDAQFLNFDDDRNFTENPYFPGLTAAHRAWYVTTGWMGHWQPLAWLSLAFDWHRAGGAALEPGPLHVTNVVLHALTAVGVLLLAARLSSGAGRGRSVVPAACAALFFAVHPLRVESVAWVTERRDVLSGFLLVACVLVWLARPPLERVERLNARPAALAALCTVAACAAFLAAVDRSSPEALRWRGAAGPLWLAAAGGLSLAALAAGRAAPAPRGARRHAAVYVSAWLLLTLSVCAKAWGVVLPALLLLLDCGPAWCAAGGGGRRKGRGRMGASRTGRVALLAEKLPFCVPAFAAGVLAAWAQRGQVGTWRSLADHSLLERGLQAAYGLVYYARQTLLPVGLSPLHALPETIAPLDPRFALSLAGVLAAGCGLWFARRRVPGVVAAALAYALLLAPVLGFFQSGPQLVADRYAYLAGIPLALLLGAGLARLRAGPAALALTVAVGLGLALLGAATRDLTRAWRDSESLWTRALALDPGSAFARLSLAAVRLDQAARDPDPERRRALAEEGRQLALASFDAEPGPEPLVNVALAHGILAEVEPRLAARHREAARQFAEQALVRAQQADLYEPRYARVLGVHLFNAGRHAEAEEFFGRYVTERPADPSGWLDLGRAREAHGDRDGARSAYERCLVLAPGQSVARERLSALGPP